MRKIRLVGFIGLIGLIGAMVGASQGSPLLAAEEKTKMVRVGRDEVIGGDFFARDGEVVISGKVLGDVYVVSASLTIDGVVEGDLLGAAGQTNISGKILGNTRLGSVNALIDGEIEGNASILAANLTLTKSATVGGSLVAAVGNFEHQGRVKQRMQAWTFRAAVNGWVDREANVWARRFSVGDRAELGELTYTSAKEVKIPSSAKISGRVKFQHPGGRIYKQVDPAQFGSKVWRILTFQTIQLKMVSFLLALVLGWLALRFFPAFTAETALTVRESFWQSLFVGGLSLLMVPLLFLALLVSIIGIPLAVVFLGGFLLALFLGKIYVALAIGRKIGYLGFLGSLGVGLLIYYLLTSLPMVGLLLAVILSLTGLGALIITNLAWYQKLSRKRLV